MPQLSLASSQPHGPFGVWFYSKPVMQYGEYRFTYINYKGESSRRHVWVRKVWWGRTKYHTQRQWIFSGWDLDKKVYRDFAMCDMSDVELVIK